MNFMLVLNALHVIRKSLMRLLTTLKVLYIVQAVWLSDSNDKFIICT